MAARAETVARSITSLDGQAQALVAMAEELAAKGRYETGTSPGFGGMCRRTVDDSVGGGVVAGAVGGQRAHWALFNHRGVDENHDAFL